MASKRNYWVVSPAVGGAGRFVDEWENVIKHEEVAVMGWGTDTDPEEHKYGRRMGDLFAGYGSPSIQIGDVILVGHGWIDRNIVAVGVVDSDRWMDDSYPEWNDNKPVQMRRLRPFQWLKGVFIPPALAAPLEQALPQNKYAMLMKPLDVDNHRFRELREWLDTQLEDARVKEKGRRRAKYSGGESLEHKRLKQWCADHPEQLGLPLRAVLVVPGTQEFCVCKPYTHDCCDVLFKMREGGYAVMEIETTDPKPGVYQALKYRTLLCARNDYPITSGKVKAVLVAWAIPAEVRDVCDRYGIDWYEKFV